MGLGQLGVNPQRIVKFRDGLALVVLFKQQRAGEQRSLPVVLVAGQRVDADLVHHKLEDRTDAIPAGVLSRSFPNPDERLGILGGRAVVVHHEPAIGLGRLVQLTGFGQCVRQYQSRVDMLRVLVDPRLGFLPGFCITSPQQAQLPLPGEQCS